jgi:hypothetical protein
MQRGLRLGAFRMVRPTPYRSASATGDCFAIFGVFTWFYAARTALEGQPKVFISHGTHDEVLQFWLAAGDWCRYCEAGHLPVEYRDFEDRTASLVQMKKEPKLFLG